MPSGSERFLDTRSLASDHRRLASLLTPGMSVLDVGCGSGAITSGIADVVGPDGRVVGIDISDELLALARRNHGERRNLSFVHADVADHGYRDEFDLVTAARVLQWLADPLAALQGMLDATKPGGQLVALDYNHTKARWEPPPPPAFTRFYDAFLAWRADAGMDNEIGDHLARMLTELGAIDVQVTEEIEWATRYEPDFEARAALWPSVIDTRGHQMVADAMVAEAERTAAGNAFTDWLATAAGQSLYLVAASATKRPAG